MPGLEQTGQLRGDDRHQRQAVALQGLRHALDREPVVDDGAGPVDHRAQHDLQPGHVVKGQAAEPAIGRVNAQVERGADRAPEVIPIGELDRPRAPGGAAGHHATVDGVEIVLAEQRQVGLGPACVACLGDGEHGPRAAELGLALGGRQPGIDRLGDRAELHQRVKQDHVIGPRRQLQGHGRAAPHAVSGEPAGRRRRLRLQLLVCDAPAIGDQGRAVGARLGSLGEPVVEDHPQG